MEFTIDRHQPQEMHIGYGVLEKEFSLLNSSQDVSVVVISALEQGRQSIANLLVENFPQSWIKYQLVQGRSQKSIDVSAPRPHCKQV
jgi:hypothetical protein